MRTHGPAGRRAKTIRTAPLERAYYHCASCRTGFCPRDRTLGIELPHDGGGRRPSLKEAAPCRPGRSATPSRADRRSAAADERRAVEPEAHRVKPTLYLGMDGTGIPVRKETGPTVRPKPARSSSRSPGRPNAGTPCRCATRTQSPPHRDGRQSRYRPRTFPLRPARREQGHPRRRRALDLGPRRRVFPRCDPDRHLPRQKPPLGRHPGPNSPRSGRNNDGTNSMPAASAPSSPPSPNTPQPATRPANASTISSATVNACAIPRSGPGACASPPASSWLQTCRRGAPQRHALASTAPMPSSPCAAILSGRFEAFWERRNAAA